MRLGNTATRILTVAPLVPLLILAITWRRPEVLWGVVLAAALLSLHEYFSIVHPDATERWFGVAWGGALAALAYWGGPATILVYPLLIVGPALFYLFRVGEMSTVIARAALMSFGLFYAGQLVQYVAFMKRDLPFGGDWVLLTLMIAWFGDTGAYFAGRFLGKTKLYPAVSPGKTRAGAVGGLVGSFLAAVLANLWFFPELGWAHGAVLTVIGGALGQCGDLVESMLKRSFGVKDSGRLLPGHGGILDRIDAVLFIAPAVYLYAQLAWSYPG